MRDRDVRDDDDDPEDDDEGLADKWRVLYWCPPGACRAGLQCVGGMHLGKCRNGNRQPSRGVSREICDGIFRHLDESGKCE